MQVQGGRQDGWAGAAASLSAEDRSLLALLQALAKGGYRFVTPTPASHARVLARPDRQVARSLRDVFGWSLPFEPGMLDSEMLGLLQAADAVADTPEGLKSRYRVSSLGGSLYLHSAYPTLAENAVFFGPDSYRLADFIAAELAEPGGVGPIVDIGAGAGVGALTAGALRPGARLVLTDVNPHALRLARINAAFAGRAVETVETAGLREVEGGIGIALANPPYIADDRGRSYRDGGEMHGAELSLDLAVEAARRLRPGGRLLLYTGAAIVEGRDPLRAALIPALEAEGCSVRYREIDPDVFGEELDRPAYRDVERIAVVGAVARKRDGRGDP